MTHARATLPLLFIAFIVAACSTHRVQLYDGPALPNQQVAVLSGSTHRKIWVVYNRTTRITVISVDGHSVDPSADEWAVLPGPHAVTTAYWVNHLFLGPGSSFASITRPVQVRLVEFTGQPGHRYRVDGRAVDIPGAPSQYPAWVEDIETGDIVGGSKDPETAPLTRRE